MTKKTFFFIDDIIWLFRDLTKLRPSSAFDNPFLKLIKKVHDDYGAKVQLNVFLETDDSYGGEKFRLSDMTDAYKAEFEAASDWLRFGLHAKSEFPDCPYINADYEKALADFSAIKAEILRFAGEKCFAKGMVTHWLPMSKGGCKAAKELGIKIMSSTYGDRIEYEKGLISPSDETMFLTNRKPESSLFKRMVREDSYTISLAGYNHLSEAERVETDGNLKAKFDAETGLYFKRFCSGHVLNNTDLDDIIPTFEPYMDKEFFCFANHEQYFYPDYVAHRPDYADRVIKACDYVAKCGYKYFFIEELA